MLSLYGISWKNYSIIKKSVLFLTSNIVTETFLSNEILLNVKIFDLALSLTQLYQHRQQKFLVVNLQRFLIDCF